MNKINRYISLEDTSLLITKAGGRCSFNHDRIYCNKILSDGRVNIGERAHIVGVNGPRANHETIPDLNKYENLIWLCPEHHKIIDADSNLDIFTVDMLKQMKERHEIRIKTGRYPFYGTKNSLNDYTVLSCLFYFINIHTLYSLASSFPDIHWDFFDIRDMIYTFNKENPGMLPLKDPIFGRSFNIFQNNYLNLFFYLKQRRCVEIDGVDGVYRWERTNQGERLTLQYLSSVENLISLIEKRFPQILQQEIFIANI